MRLVRQLSIAISLGVCIVLGFNAWLRVNQERRDYRADVTRDHAAIGRGLASAVEFVWVRQGQDVALQVVEQLNRRESHVTIRWVWRRAEQGESAHRPIRQALVPRPGEKGRSAIVAGEHGMLHMLSYAPADVPGGRGGAIELYESLAPERDALRGILLRATITMGVLLTLCVGLTVGFGVLFVARPMRVLVRKAERIGAGDLAGPIAFTQDTEIRELASAMNIMCERLADARTRVQRETQARIDALDQLRHADRLRTVGELASGIAHQLGTPLNVVRARGSMIASGKVSDARTRELGNVIVENVDMMSDTIRQLLDFARRQQPKFASGDLSKTLEQTLGLVEPLAHQRRVRLMLVPHAATATLRMDSGQIHQALTNIIINAVHATPESGTVGVELHEEAESWVVSVRDGGQGIAPEHLPHIFEPFYTTKRAGEGTGLGLSVAEGIIREHGGNVEVESIPEHGTVFRVMLPKSR